MPVSLEAFSFGGLSSYSNFFFFGKYAACYGVMMIMMEVTDQMHPRGVYACDGGGHACLQLERLCCL